MVRIDRHVADANVPRMAASPTTGHPGQVSAAAQPVGVDLVMAMVPTVSRDGRISPWPIWNLERCAVSEPLTRIARFMANAMLRMPSLQIAHAGPKAKLRCAMAMAPALDRERRRLSPALAPTANPLRSDRSRADRLSIKAAIHGRGDLVAAAGRALEAGFKVVEFHSAHGISCTSSSRRSTISAAMPMAAAWRTACGCPCASPKRSGPATSAVSRSSCAFPPPTGSMADWDIEHSVEFARREKERGIDLIEVLAGARCRMPRFQCLATASGRRFAERIRAGRRSRPRRSA